MQDQHYCHKYHGGGEEGVDEALEGAAEGAGKDSDVGGAKKPVGVEDGRVGRQHSGYQKHGGHYQLGDKHLWEGVLQSGVVTVSVRDRSGLTVTLTSTVSEGRMSATRSGHSIRQRAPESK